jgi:hypothetical protein
MTRNACLAAVLLAMALTGLFAGSAGARTNVAPTPAPVFFACAGPSANDVADSDFFWYWSCASFLHVSVTPSGMALGYVQSTPYAIDCPHACTRPFADGTKVTLTAHPSEGGNFDGWGAGACAGQGNPCVVTISGDTQVAADFSGTAISPTAGPLSTLSMFMGNTTGTTVTGTGGFVCAFGVCTKDYVQGTTVTLTATGGVSPPFFFCDSTTGTTHQASPYRFVITGTATRYVSPRHTGGTC